MFFLFPPWGAGGSFLPLSPAANRFARFRFEFDSPHAGFFLFDGNGPGFPSQSPDFSCGFSVHGRGDLPTFFLFALPPFFFKVLNVCSLPADARSPPFSLGWGQIHLFRHQFLFPVLYASQQTGRSLNAPAEHPRVSVSKLPRLPFSRSAQKNDWLTPFANSSWAALTNLLEQCAWLPSSRQALRSLFLRAEFFSFSARISLSFFQLKWDATPFPPSRVST